MPPIEFPPDRQRYSEYRHCPRCGSAYRPQDFQPAAGVFLCAGCSFDFYQNPLPSAVAVIAQPGRAEAVLFLRRLTTPNIGRWCVPGGFVVYGETPAAAAVREAREEVGLEVTVESLLHAGLVDYSYRGKQICILEVGFVARLAGPEPPPGFSTPEASETAFIAVDEILREPEMLAFAEQASLMRAYRDYLGRH